MINDRTVFVLGAGASKPYGFPTGNELRIRILEQHQGSLDPNRLRNRRLIDEICNGVFPREVIDNFYSEFKASDVQSIDVFLEDQPDEYKKIGRFLIFYLILEYERESLRSVEFPLSGNWYQYLFAHMRTPKESFSANHVQFITFNYDRTLEQYLLNTLQAIYKIRIPECVDMLRNIPIVHLHGQCGKIFTPGAKDFVSYGGKLASKEIYDRTSQIKIIHDTDTSYEYSQAKMLLNEAHRIIFLGCAYHRENMLRLGIGDYAGKAQIIAGSSKGLTERIAARIRDQFHVLQLPVPGIYDALEFLRHEVDIV